MGVLTMILPSLGMIRPFLSELFFECPAVEADHNVAIDNDDGDSSLTGDPDHFTCPLPVPTNLDFFIADTFLRKKLFRLVAVWSRVQGVDDNFL